MTLMDDRPTTFAERLVLSYRGQDGFDDLVKLAKAPIRRVKTAEGAKIYGQPIGTVITADMLNPPVKNIGALNALPVGSKVVETSSNGKKKVSYTRKPDIGGQAIWENNQTKKYVSAAVLSSAINLERIHVQHIPGEDSLDTEGDTVPAAGGAAAIGTKSVGRNAPTPEGKALDTKLKAQEAAAAAAKGGPRPQAAALGSDQKSKVEAKAPINPVTGSKEVVPTPPVSPKGAVQAQTPGPGSPPLPVSNQAAAPSLAPEAPSEVPTPQAPPVASLADLQALPPGSKINYKTTGGDVRTYTKEPDGRFSGPSGFHDAADFENGAKSGRVTALAEVPGEIPPEPTATDGSPVTQAKPKSLTGMVESVDEMKLAPAGSVMYQDQNGKKVAVTKGDDKLWRGEGPNKTGYDSTLFQKEIDEGNLSWDEDAVPETPAEDVSAPEAAPETPAEPPTPGATDATAEAAVAPGPPKDGTPVKDVAELDAAPTGTAITNKKKTTTFTKGEDGTFESSATGNKLAADGFGPALEQGNILYGKHDAPEQKEAPAAEKPKTEARSAKTPEQKKAELVAAPVGARLKITAGGNGGLIGNEFVKTKLDSETQGGQWNGGGGLYFYPDDLSDYEYDLDADAKAKEAASLKKIVEKAVKNTEDKIAADNAAKVEPPKKTFKKGDTFTEWENLKDLPVGTGVTGRFELKYDGEGNKPYEYQVFGNYYKQANGKWKRQGSTALLDDYDLASSILLTYSDFEHSYEEYLDLPAVDRKGNKKTPRPKPTNLHYEISGSADQLEPGYYAHQGASGKAFGAGAFAYIKVNADGTGTYVSKKGASANLTKDQVASNFAGGMQQYMDESMFAKVKELADTYIKPEVDDTEGEEGKKKGAGGLNSSIKLKPNSAAEKDEGVVTSLSELVAAPAGQKIYDEDLNVSYVKMKTGNKWSAEGHKGAAIDGDKLSGLDTGKLQFGEMPIAGKYQEAIDDLDSLKTYSEIKINNGTKGGAKFTKNEDGTWAGPTGSAVESRHVLGLDKQPVDYTVSLDAGAMPEKGQPVQSKYELENAPAGTVVQMGGGLHYQKQDDGTWRAGKMEWGNDPAGEYKQMFEMFALGDLNKPVTSAYVSIVTDKKKPTVYKEIGELPVETVSTFQSDTFEVGKKTKKYENLSQLPEGTIIRNHKNGAFHNKIDDAGGLVPAGDNLYMKNAAGDWVNTQTGKALASYDLKGKQLGASKSYFVVESFGGEQVAVDDTPDLADLLNAPDAPTPFDTSGLPDAPEPQVEPSLAVDLAFISKPANDPYTEAEIMAAPIGAKVLVKASKNSDAPSVTYTKQTDSDYWQNDNPALMGSVHMPSEAAAGLVYNYNQSVRNNEPTIKKDATGTYLMVGTKKVPMKSGDGAYHYAGDKSGSIYVVDGDTSEWTQYAPDGFVTELGHNWGLDDKIYNGSFENLDPEIQKATKADFEATIAAALGQVPGVEPAIKTIPFESHGEHFVAPEGSLLYEYASGAESWGDVIVIDPNGDMRTYTKIGTGPVTAFKADLTGQTIINQLINSGALVKVTDKAKATKLHPSGLKPGKYSTNASAKVYMLVNEDGTALYIDKSGNAKPLGTKGVLGKHAAGMQHYSTWDGVLPVPSTPQPVAFKALYGTEGGPKSFEVPAGSKVYHNNLAGPDNALVKYVQYPDGNWAKVNVDSGELESIPEEMAISDHDISTGNYLLENAAPVKTAPEKKTKATAPTFEADASGYVPNPFSAPPNFSYKTSVLSAEIARLANEAGFKNVAGLNRQQMSKDQKQQWLKAFYAGDFERAYELELEAGVKKDPNSKVNSIQELIDAPIFTKLVTVEYGTSYGWQKIDDYTWQREGSYQTRTTENFENSINGYERSTHFPHKAVHTKAAKHPGSPANPANAGGVKKVMFGSPVPGELPAGVKPKGGEGTGLTEDLSEFEGGDSSYWSDEQVDAYLLASGMVNSQGLAKHQKKNWVSYHIKGNKPSTDLLSVEARNNVEKGIFKSEEITPPAPIIPAGESVPDFTPEKPFNAESSHANNLTDFETAAYLSPLFSKKAAAAVRNQSFETRKALVQLHWLSTQPNTDKAHKSPSAAKLEWTELAKSIEEQMAPKVASYNGTMDYSLSLPEFEVKKIWKKAATQPNYKGAFEKYDIEDDSGAVLFFKPGKSEWRAQVADAANKIGQFFGFKTAGSELMTVDGKIGQAQRKVPNDGSTAGKRPEDLTEKQLLDLFREHVLDWAIDQDDSHEDQFLLAQDGGLVGIDKDRAFASFGHNKLERGKLSTNPSVVEKVYYESLYKSAVDGKIDAATLQKGYKAAIARARSMQNLSDEKYIDLLEYAFEKNPKLTKDQKDDLIVKVVNRKNNLVNDFEKFWSDLLSDAGVEKPDPSKVSDKAGLHAGITPELIEDVKKSKNWGHAAFYASQDLEDGHVMLWEEKDGNGGPAILNGTALLLEGADAKMVAWLANNYSGPDSVGNNSQPDKTLKGMQSATDKILAGYKTIGKHIEDQQFNAGTLGQMKIQKEILEKETKQDVLLEYYPGQPKKQAAHKEMAEFYIKAIDDAMEAKENGVKPPLFGSYNYVWQDEESVDLPKPLVNNFTVTKRNGSYKKAGLDKDSNLVTTGELSTDGQSGIDYVIDFPDGSQITYRPWTGEGYYSSVYKSQQGKLRFSVPKYGDSAAEGEKMMNFLRSEIGIEADDASDESLELQYWRTYHGTMSKRSDGHSGKYEDLQIAINANDPRKMDDPAAELERWRVVMGHIAGPEAVEKFVENQGYLPSFSRYQLDDADGHGRPWWNRFDVDIDKIRLEGNFLARSVAGLSGGNYPMADDKILKNIRRGGVAPAEERERTSGAWKDGVSGAADSGAGSGSFTMIRQNIENSDYHIYFDPALMARVSSYAYSSDNFGNMDYKKTQGHWDISKQMKHSGSGNEGVIKGGMSILDDAVLAVFDSPAKRQTAIAEYRAMGHEDINGTPLEEFFVLRKDRAAGLKNAHERMKARVLGTGYDPKHGAFAPKASSSLPATSTPQPLGWKPKSDKLTVAEIDEAPVGTIVGFPDGSQLQKYDMEPGSAWEVVDQENPGKPTGQSQGGSTVKFNAGNGAITFISSPFKQADQPVGMKIQEIKTGATLEKKDGDYGVGWYWLDGEFAGQNYDSSFLSDAIKKGEFQQPADAPSTWKPSGPNLTVADVEAAPAGTQGKFPNGIVVEKETNALESPWKIVGLADNGVGTIGSSQKYNTIQSYASSSHLTFVAPTGNGPNVGKTITKDLLKQAPIGTQFTYENGYGEPKTWEKYDVDSWMEQGNPSNTADNDIYYSNYVEDAIFVAWPVGGAAAAPAPDGKPGVVTKSKMSSAPQGAQVTTATNTLLTKDSSTTDGWKSEATGNMIYLDGPAWSDEDFDEWNWVSGEPTSAAAATPTPSDGDEIENLSQLQALPQGSEVVVDLGNANGLVYTKAADGDWYNQSNEDAMPNTDGDMLTALNLTNGSIKVSKIGGATTAKPVDPNAPGLDKYNTNKGFIPENKIQQLSIDLAVGSKITLDLTGSGQKDETDYEKQPNGNWKMVSSTNPTFMESATEFDSTGWGYVTTAKVTYDANDPFGALFDSPKAVADADAGIVAEASQGGYGFTTLIEDVDELKALPIGAKFKTGGEHFEQWTKTGYDEWTNTQGNGYAANDFHGGVGHGSYWLLPESQWLPTPAPDASAAGPTSVDELDAAPVGTKVTKTYKVSGITRTFIKQADGKWAKEINPGQLLNGVQALNLLGTGTASNGALSWQGYVPTPDPAKFLQGQASGFLMGEAPVGTRVKRFAQDGGTMIFIKKSNGNWRRESIGAATSDHPMFDVSTTDPLFGEADQSGNLWFTEDSEFDELI